jgi:polygalacturonase
MTVVTPQAHGAKGDVVSNDTLAVRAAVAACVRCTLLFANGTFLTGPFSLPLSSEVVVDGTILAAPMSWWKPAGWEGRAAFMQADGRGTSIFSSRATSLTIHGSGTINGQGQAWWRTQVPVRNDSIWRPNLLRLSHITGLTVRDVRMVDSPNHNLLIADSTRVRVSGLRIDAPHDSPNTDGINVAGGSDQLVADSVISNGDDCVTAVTSTETPPPGPGPWPTTRAFGGSLLVRNLTCVGGHGISIGSVRTGVVTNVSVSDVVFMGGENGCRIKAYPNNTGLVANISYRNIRVEHVANPIRINAFYCHPNQKPYPCPAGSHAVVIQDVSLENVTGSASSLDGLAGSFTCSSVGPCRRLSLRHVNISTPRGGKSAHFECKQAHGTASDVYPQSCLEDSELLRTVSAT